MHRSKASSPVRWCSEVRGDQCSGGDPGKDELSASVKTQQDAGGPQTAKLPAAGRPQLLELRGINVCRFSHPGSHTVLAARTKTRTHVHTRVRTHTHNPSPNFLKKLTIVTVHAGRRKLSEQYKKYQWIRLASSSPFYRNVYAP